MKQQQIANFVGNIVATKANKSATEKQMFHPCKNGNFRTVIAENVPELVKDENGKTVIKKDEKGYTVVAHTLWHNVFLTAAQKEAIEAFPGSFLRVSAEQRPDLKARENAADPFKYSMISVEYIGKKQAETPKDEAPKKSRKSKKSAEPAAEAA